MAKSGLLNVMKNAPADLRLVLLVLSAALVGLVSVWLSYEVVLRPQSASYVQYRRFMKSDVEPKVVFLGDSRALHGLHHAAMDRQFYNYAYFGEAPYGQILRARHVLRDKPSVRTFVMQLDAYVVGGQRTYHPLPQSRSFYESLLYSSLPDVQEVIGPTRDDTIRNIIGFYFPLTIWWERADYWGAIRQTLTRLGIDDAPRPARYFNGCGDLVNMAGHWGWMGESERIQAAASDAAARYKVFKLDPQLVVMIRDFIAHARQQGVRVIGLRLPETIEFREASKHIMDPALDRFTDDLGIPVLDYREAYLSSPELFVDPDHLSEEGALMFSKRVARDVRALLALPQGEPWHCPATRLVDADPALPFAWALRR
jgi:hypothetical protein